MGARDILMIAVLLFMFSLGFFVINYMVGTAVDQMVNIPALNETEDFVVAMDGMDRVISKFDYVLFGLFIALVLSLIVTGYFVGGNPIFMFVYFIVVIITVVLSTIFANTWEQITETAVFGTTVTAFPIANNLMLNLPIYMSVVGFLGLVAMFGKPFVSDRLRLGFEI